ncbi:MAG: 16S rRNA (uracil(1498)-N(3))-methyltransferase [Chitinispirillia bacterium]|nr:16S rRNA (uracil(1498)-N(3))-methyltransferase [Chitinispirillia bacterium]
MRDTEHHLFYSREITEDRIILDESETTHAISVLRIKDNDPIQITDGNGTVFQCEYSERLKNTLSCKVINKTIITKVNPELTLLIGIPDKEPFETVIEQTTALGVCRIIPVVMDHCRKPWWESWDKILPRFTSKMIVSMKQSLYPYIPVLDKPIYLTEIIDKCAKPIIIADQQGKILRDEMLTSQKKLSCLIGPPGGFSVEEKKTLESYNMLTVKISRQRLRTELAAVVLCSRIMASSL